MTDLPINDLKEVLARAGALAIALRSLPDSDPVPKRIANLLQKDIAQMSAALRANDPDAAETALAFPSLDGRAADALGGFEFESHAETADLFTALNNAIIKAVEEF
jgi:hypothetical protein